MSIFHTLWIGFPEQLSKHSCEQPWSGSHISGPLFIESPMYRNEFSTPTVVVERLSEGKSPIPVEEKGAAGP